MIVQKFSSCSYSQKLSRGVSSIAFLRLDWRRSSPRLFEECIMKRFYYLLSDEVGAQITTPECPSSRTWAGLGNHEPDTQVIPPPGLATCAESPTQSSLCATVNWSSNHLPPIRGRIRIESPPSIRNKVGLLEQKGTRKGKKERKRAAPPSPPQALFSFPWLGGADDICLLVCRLNRMSVCCWR